MKIRLVLALATAAFVFAGCATHVQPPVELKTQSISDKSVRVGVVMTELPKVNTYFPGAGCLLCMATAEVANSSLTKHAKSLTLEDIPSLKDQAAEILRKKGLSVTVIPETLNLDGLPSHRTDGQNVAGKDFAALSAKYQIDKLIVLSVDSVGFSRAYSAYIPSGDPKAIFHGVGYMVDLKTNAYEWYTVADITRAAGGTWDEAPSYPGLTNAYFQVLELGKDAFLKPFVQ